MLGKCDACAELFERRQARVESNLVVLHRKFAFDSGPLDLVQGQIELQVEAGVTDGLQFIREAFDAARNGRNFA